MIVEPNDRAAGCLGEPARYYGVDDAGRARADQLGADPDCACTMAGPAHSERTRMIGEDVP
jgi:hypothetical protein